MSHFLNSFWVQWLIISLAGFMIGLEMKSYRIQIHPDTAGQTGTALILLSAVMLPLLPNKLISPYLPI